MVFAPADFHARRPSARIILPIGLLSPGHDPVEIVATTGDEQAMPKLRFAVR